MGLVTYRIARAACAAALAVSASSQAQDAPLGVVQQATLAHVRQANITEGATFYPGEELSTDVSGTMALSIDAAGFRLLENTRAFFYAGSSGPVAELRSGTLTFRKEAGGGNITILASDVKIVTKDDGAVSGHVIIISPCEVRVSTVIGRLEVTAGSELQAMNERETYSVTPDRGVIDSRSSLSPEDPGYHQTHSHKSCRIDSKWPDKPPAGTTPSHFFKWWYLAPSCGHPSSAFAEGPRSKPEHSLTRLSASWRFARRECSA